MAPNVVRAAAYQRVSSKEQEADRQREANRARAAREGWQLTEYEESLSASRFASKHGALNRAEYRQLVAAIRAALVDVLILWESSRGDRQLTGWSTLLDLCREYGVLIHITSEDYTYDVRKTRDWKALAEAGIDSALEVEKMSLRVRDGKRSRAAKGVPQGSVAYGLRRFWDPSRQKLNWDRDEPDPETGPVAARIIRAVGAGVAYGVIAATLDAEGVPAPKGGKWGRTSVRSIAKNPVYVRFGVVTEAESLKARARVTDAQRKGERPARQRYRYSMLMGCGKDECDGIIRGMLVHGWRTYYTCPRNHAQHGNTIAVDVADGYLDDRFINVLASDGMDLITGGDDSAAERFRTEAAGYRQQIAEAAASYAAGRIGIESLETITATLEPKARVAEKRAEEAGRPSAVAGLPDRNRVIVAERWATLTISARKAAVRALAPDLTLLPGADLPVSQRIILPE
jgi:site-specific DNA recombinase